MAALARKVTVLVAPLARSAATGRRPAIDLRWLLKKLGSENVTSLLVEGGGEVNASFLLGGLAQRVAFFYAPKILGGRDARKAVAGEGARTLGEWVPLPEVKWRKLGADLLLTARVGSAGLPERGSVSRSSVAKSLCRQVIPEPHDKRGRSPS